MDQTPIQPTYQEFDVLGSGTYGTVYKAINQLNNTVVAIKHIKNVDDGEGIPTTSLREISYLRQLAHPQVISLLETHYSVGQDFVTSAKLVFQMGYSDLAKYLSRDRLPNQNLIKSLVKQMLLGLDFIHSKGFIHRDLKPQNFILFEQNRLKLGDFGLCRRRISEEPMTLEVGSLWYRAPEVMLGVALYTSSMDIWAVGCILYQLYEGQVMFKSSSEIECLFKIFQWAGTPTSESAPSLLKKSTRFSRLFPKFNKRNMKYKRLPDTALDLLNRMLNLDFEARISAKEALQHEFFK